MFSPYMYLHIFIYREASVPILRNDIRKTVRDHLWWIGPTQVSLCQISSRHRGPHPETSMFQQVGSMNKYIWRRLEIKYTVVYSIVFNKLTQNTNCHTLRMRTISITNRTRALHSGPRVLGRMPGRSFGPSGINVESGSIRRRWLDSTALWDPDCDYTGPQNDCIHT